MKEKEKLILETSMKLFANKGYKSTSIQEIVNECGISKGAFYLYFSSKDSLLLAIFHYYYTQFTERVSEMDKLDLAPREKFEKQLWCQFDGIHQQKEFIMMYMREHTGSFTGEIEQLILRMQTETTAFYENGLRSLYGERITPFLYDIITILHGMCHAYLELLIFNKATIDLHYVASFILHRMDDIVAGLEKSREEPVLVEYKEMELICAGYVDKRTLVEHIITMKNTLDSDSYLYITLDVVELELKMEEPRIPVIQGMLSNLRTYPEAEELKKQIERYFHLSNE
ncbi:TetR/AcrR family transcriptional regulator [Priestia taiwanensis]|uniref:TetR family transcriptional regulator n=1 Tax=Priestia taiwanensis TaxID=1347902 RepID=A0A917ESN1_9BACI|nr:TetR/AcrR family transcriptional regulator [Priestia taiwanensis]MBM7364909.1 AcrR family transcriptional regulator [Priestia taiwanensis]GGE82665.1 TetR family transcriptional regulator [Priestia taiwanensis]